MTAWFVFVKVFREVDFVSYFIFAPVHPAVGQMGFDFALIVFVYACAQGDAFVIAEAAVGHRVAVFGALHLAVFGQGLFYGDFGVAEKGAGIDLADLALAETGAGVEEDQPLPGADLFALASEGFLYGLKQPPQHIIRYTPDQRGEFLEFRHSFLLVDI